MRKTYFPGLNTIRLYAALSVVIGHTVSFTPGYTFTFDLYSKLSLITFSGYQAVSLFFVLSGFLITYILLSEKLETGNIALQRFYIRRALRIQPLYILIILLTLAIGILPKPDTIGFISLILMSPHLAMGVSGGLGALIMTWSIGVEEWFYFILPPLVKRINVPLLAGVVILVRLILALAIPELMVGWGTPSDPFVAILSTLRIESMAIGALGAWMLINRHWLLRWIYKIQLPALVLVALIILFDWQEGFSTNFSFSWLYLIVILNVATNPRPKINLEHRTLSALGKVSYGIYMYHLAICYLVSSAFVRLGLRGSWADAALYAVIIVSVIGVALMSYRWFESWFLKLQPSQTVKPIKQVQPI